MNHPQSLGGADGTVTGEIQLLFVGDDERCERELAAKLGPHRHGHISLRYHQRETIEWQSRRAPGAAGAVIMHRGRAAIQETVAWIQVISLAFRPNRLVVVLPHFDYSNVLQLSRAGADGILTGNPSPEEIIRELHQEGVRGTDFFPDPNQWLSSLRRANEELLLGNDPATQLNKLLKLFISQLKMDRASVLLCERDGVRLAAGVCLGQNMKIGTLQVPHPSSITAWVIEHRRPRLVEGHYHGTASETAVRNAICVPMMSRDKLIGIVNFSSLKSGRQLTPSDLAAAEVFASLIAMSISNHRLHGENVQAERLATVGRTTATVAHCIKNILQIFKGSAMLLGQESGANASQGVRMLERATARLEALVRDLLDFSKVREPQLESVDVGKLLSDVCAVYDNSIYGKYHINVDCSVAGELLLDGERLQRALINLVSNSIDVMPNGGRVKLHAAIADDRLVITVSDEGPGVAEKQLETIFDPFFSTKGSKGTGLGLATVKKFCEENGGAVSASHCAELGGLRVRIELPCLPDVH